MEKLIITQALLRRYEGRLRDEEKSAATVDKYMREARRFARYAGAREANKGVVLAYKSELGRAYPPKSANSMLAALNSLLRFAGRNDLSVRQFRLQTETYRSESAELTREEYFRLVSAAEQKGDTMTSLLLQTVCCSGIRVSELGFVTAEAAAKGETTVSCKGKTRKIFIVSALREKLLKYAEENGVVSGPLFLTRGGDPIGRSTVWRRMKALCAAAGIPGKKVFPHNLRHLFARTFYEQERDIAALADILGHSSVNTTRIYIISTGAEHARKLENMGLTI